MKQNIWKAFWDYRKEEAWLNAMAAKGLSMTDYSWCRYVFEETEPGAYQYRIELLEQVPDHPESRSYLHFLEGTGVEVVAVYVRWVYLRQKTSEGGFELFSDTASRLAHGRKVTALYTALMTLEFLCGLPNLLLGILQWREHGPTFNLWVGLPCLALGFVFLFALLLPHLRRMRRLEAETRIRE
jgi:hypothetical protein